MSSIFDLNHSTEQPILTCQIGRGNDYKRQIAATSLQYCSDLEEWQAASFDFIEDAYHNCYSILTIMKSGTIYKLMLNK